MVDNTEAVQENYAGFQIELAWPDQAQSNLQTLLSVRSPKNTPIYGVIDSAADESLYDRLMLEPAKSQVTCLFEAAPAIRYRDVAPYIFMLNLDSPLTLAWLVEGWRQHWGIWLSTTQPINLLKAHLKKFLFVQTARKEKAYFRFYDPRVMNQIMLIMTPEQRGKFFGLDHKFVPEAIYTVEHKSTQASVLQRFMPKQSLMMKLSSASDLRADRWAWQQVEHHEP